MDREENRRASELRRQSSTRRSARLSSDSSLRDGDDDLDVAAFAVADGFRPPQVNSPQRHSHPSPSSPRHVQRHSLQRPPSILQYPPPVADATSKFTGFRNRPSSISKHPRQHDSLTLRNDGSGNMRFGAGQPDTSQASGLATTSATAEGDGPYRGPTGPSHPYHMYPQRTLSNATSSATPVIAESLYDGPRGPTYPYALYTQNVAPDGASSSSSERGNIPVGFSGVGSVYHRQLGPDGEEVGDLIGPLGHLEELPPYSKYPEHAAYQLKHNASRSRSSQETTTEATASSSQQPPPPPPPPPPPQEEQQPVAEGAGGLGLATRDPEYATSDDELHRASSRRSVRSNESARSQYQINTAALSITEKAQEKRWRRKAKNKIGGVIPCWAVCLLAVALVLIGVVVGAVIGTLVSKHHENKNEKNDHNGSYPTGVDIQPIPTLPPNLPPLSLGPFSLPPLDVSQSPKTCFKDTTQAQAWSCEIPHRYYQIDVRHCPVGSPLHSYELTLTPVNAADSEFIWGTQPPNIPVPMNLTLVNDIFDLGRGPAWWLKTYYNKTVIVPENQFSSGSQSPSSSSRKREWQYDPTFFLDFETHKFRRKAPGAQNGDMPWICEWPNVSLEIFIYPSQNVSYLYGAGGSSSSITPSASLTPTPTPTNNYPASTATLPFKPDPAYPQVIKFLERHISADDAHEPATCRQVEIVNGQAVQLKDGNGNPIIVDIQEDTDTWQAKLNQHSRSRTSEKRSLISALLEREVLELTDCGCLWLST